MTKKLTYFLLLCSCCILAQQLEKTTANPFIITPEIMAGITADSNSFFPDHDFQKQLIINLGWEHDHNPQEWAQRLKGPRTGLGFGYTDFGNAENLGGAITAMPFIEFNTFRKEKLKAQVGMGVSYFTKKYDSISNPFNQAVSTDLTWSFRLFMHYQFISAQKIDWRVGLGYFHHSNGHTRLPNQGYNSFLLSLSADIKDPSKIKDMTDASPKQDLDRSIYDYFSFRAGYGINALSLIYFNNKKGVYTISGEYGKVLNNTFKLGGGFYYRMYQHYYDYIRDNESLVQDGREFDFFKEDPWRYATNLGVFIKGEFLLNHFGIDLQLGANLHKPAYRIDWRINEGWDNTPRDIPENWVLGEFGSKFKLKHAISSRMGIKYYLIGTSKAPKNNLFLSFHINTNLGQADFTELSLGYVYGFNFKERK